MTVEPFLPSLILLSKAGTYPSGAPYDAPLIRSCLKILDKAEKGLLQLISAPPSVRKEKNDN